MVSNKEEGRCSCKMTAEDYHWREISQGEKRWIKIESNLSASLKDPDLSEKCSESQWKGAPFHIKGHPGWCRVAV